MSKLKASKDCREKRSQKSVSLFLFWFSPMACAGQSDLRAAAWENRWWVTDDAGSSLTTCVQWLQQLLSLAIIHCETIRWQCHVWESRILQYYTWPVPDIFVAVIMLSSVNRQERLRMQFVVQSHWGLYHSCASGAAVIYDLSMIILWKAEILVSWEKGWLSRGAAK